MHMSETPNYRSDEKSNFNYVDKTLSFPDFVKISHGPSHTETSVLTQINYTVPKVRDIKI